MYTELHVLIPRRAGDQYIANSVNWIGVVNKVLMVKKRSFSIRRDTIPVKEFKEYWLPPEMTMKKTRPFQALITFDEAGEIVAVGYPLGELTWSEAIEVMPIAGVASEEPRFQKVISVAISVTDVAPSGKCILTFPVVEHDGKKLFALPDGWFTNAIPALEEFVCAKYLVGPQGAERRWNHPFFNLTAIRAGKIIARGGFHSTGGMGEYTVASLSGFTEGSYPTRVFVDKFEVGDKVRLQLAWYGQYPIVQMLLREVAIANVSPSMEIGKQYSGQEFMAIAAKDLTESSQRILPDMLKTKVILFNKK